LDELFSRMTTAQFDSLKAAVCGLPVDLFEASANEVRELVSWLRTSDARCTYSQSPDQE